VAVDLARVAAVIDRIAADIDELARARRVQDPGTAAVLPGPRAERRRRLAEPDLEFRAFCARRGLPASSTPQLERAWDAWQAERYRRGEPASGRARPATRSGHADHPPVCPRSGNWTPCGAHGSIVTGTQFLNADAPARTS
jgi:hypothetical protein